MESKLVQTLPSSMRRDSMKLSSKPTGSINGSFRWKEKTVQMPIQGRSRQKITSTCKGKVLLEVSSSYKKFSGSTLESGSAYTSFDEGLILKNKAQDVIPYLNGRCIYLVGMMGSGKTTVGKILSEVIGYSFFDSDKLVEQAVGGTPVSEIFKLYGEGFFRDKETEALRNLSLAHHIVASTGGGAVIRPINWRYMQKGVSVWLDVPLEALAQRIAAVGTHSRPLLHHESGDVYTKAFTHLSALLGERSDAYATADTRVSLENIAAKLGHRDVSNLTPTIIAIEALKQIEGYLKDEDGMPIQEFQC